MTRRRSTALVLAALALAIAAATYLLLRDGGDARPASAVAAPTATPDPPRSTSVPEPPADRDARSEKLARIRAARVARLAARPDPAPQGRDEPDPDGVCEEGCWGSLGLQLQLANVVSGCRELLPEGATGRARFEARVIAEPEIGAVVESVEVLDDTIEVPAFVECLVESAPLAELAEPEAPVADRFVFRYSADGSADNATDFLEDNPEIVEAHPELAAIARRTPDDPPADDDATTFARVVAGDPDAREAYGRWVNERGVDLSKVRED